MSNSSLSISSQDSHGFGATVAQERDLARFVTLAGRVLYSAIFIMASLGHFSRAEIDYAAQQGVPMAGLLVPFSGVMALAGGVSVLLGYRTKIGAWVLVLFLIPVTVMLHNFWAVKDPMMAQMQLAMFMKNISMMGAALLISQFGAGPLSLDARRDSSR